MGAGLCGSCNFCGDGNTSTNTNTGELAVGNCYKLIPDTWHPNPQVGTAITLYTNEQCFKMTELDPANAQVRLCNGSLSETITISREEFISKFKKFDCPN